MDFAVVAVEAGAGKGERAMAPWETSKQDVADLVDTVAEAAGAYIRGDMRTYFELIRQGDDFVLMSPFGGEPARGATDTSPAALQALADYFRGGTADLEVIETYASGELVVLVAVERQHGEVGGLPAQDWSLRVTLVFRRDGAGWRQVHRHADPLVHPISLDRLSGLARGDDPARPRPPR